MPTLVGIVCESRACPIESDKGEAERNDDWVAYGEIGVWLDGLRECWLLLMVEGDAMLVARIYALGSS